MLTARSIFLSQQTGGSQEVRKSLPCTPEEDLALDGLWKGVLWSSIQSCMVSQHSCSSNSIWGIILFLLWPSYVPGFWAKLLSDVLKMAVAAG